MLKETIEKSFILDDGIYRTSREEGYWSNINKDQQAAFMADLQANSSREVIRRRFPQWEDMIFNSTRAVGLRLLDIRPDQTGIDYGCMWGNLMCYAARSCRRMVGVDQTLDSLKFLKHRLRDEGLDNCRLINTNLRKPLHLENTFDFSIVNGVLEWIPDTSDIELQRHYTVRGQGGRQALPDPQAQQQAFLENVGLNLKPGGKLYLAIENRFHYHYFLGKRDPHTGLMGTACLPRKLASLVSKRCYQRPFVNYIYSKNELAAMLRRAGFESVEMFAAFPDYHFPQRIIPMDNQRRPDFVPAVPSQPAASRLRQFINLLLLKMDALLFGKLGFYMFAPAIIAIARKGLNR